MPWPPLSCWAVRRTTAVPPVTSPAPVTRAQAALLTGGRSPCRRGEALQNTSSYCLTLSLVSFKLLTAHPLIIQSFHRFICSSFHTALFMTRWLWHRPQNDASDWQHMRVYVSVIDLRTTGTLLSQRSGNWGQRMEAAASRHPAGPEWRTALTDRHQVRPHSISDELLKGRGINVRCLEVKRGKDQWRLLEKMNEQTKQLTEWKTERENGLRRMAVNIQKLKTVFEAHDDRNSTADVLLGSEAFSAGYLNEAWL